MTKALANRDKVKNVQVLERASDLIDLVASRQDELTLKDIAERSGLHPSTVHRILWNLAQANFLERTTDGYWRLGFKFTEYGNLIEDRFDIRAKALPMMQSLSEVTGLTVNLVVRRGDRTANIAHVFSSGKENPETRRLGTMAPLHCTGSGKLFLSEERPGEIRAYIERTRLEPCTKKSIVLPEQLILALNRARDLGWSQENEEWTPGFSSLSVPIRDRSKRIVATLSLSFSARIEKKPDWVKQLLQSARSLSENLGSLRR